MARDLAKLLRILLFCLVIAAAALSAVHTHANPGDHESCALCRFASTLNLFILAVIGAVIGSASSETFRRFAGRTDILRLPEFLLGKIALRAPPALLTA